MRRSAFSSGPSIAIFALLLALTAEGQMDTWSGRLHGGYVLPHREEMNALVTGHARGVGFRMGTAGKEDWRSGWSRKGDVWQGVELGWLYGGSASLGHVISALWILELPISKSAHAEVGAGLGWATAPYDMQDRPLSIALGTHLNAGLHLALSQQLRTFNSSVLSLSGGLTHFSNGAVQLPNLGINNIHLGLTLERRGNARATDEATLLTTGSNDAEHFARWTTTAAVRAGVRDVPLAGKPLHPISSAMIATERRWNQRWGCLFALDITYNQSLRALSSEPLATNERIQLASGIGNQWHFGRAHLALLQGWVWTNPDHILGRRHLHTALAYEINEHVSFEIGLRSFRLRADYTFLGIRFRL